MIELLKNIGFSILHGTYYICIVLIAAIPAFAGDKMTEQPRNFIGNATTLPWYKRRQPTSVGWAFVGLVVLSCILGSIRTYFDNEASAVAHKRELKLVDSMYDMRLAFRDSLDKRDEEKAEIKRESQVKKVQVSIDSVNNKFTEKSFQYENLSLKLQLAQQENMRFQKEANSPYFTDAVDRSQINPVLKYDSIRKRNSLVVCFTNDGHGVAKNVLINTRIVFMLKDDRLFVAPSPPSPYNDTATTIREGNPYLYIKPFQSDDVIPRYVCVEVSYKNLLGEKRKPYRVVYLYDPAYLNCHIPRVTTEIKYKITNYLVSNGYWKD